MAMKGILHHNRLAQDRGLRAGRSLWSWRSFALVLSSAVVLAVGTARAAENRFRDAPSSHTITVVDPGLLLPATLTIGQGEALQFANYSSEAIRLVFIEPKDSADEVHCRPADNPDRAAKASPSFAGGPTQHLTVTIPPGRYTTACSLTPGRYAFVTTRVGRDPRSPLDALGEKGTITVE
jgi:hypothetical protein